MDELSANPFWHALRTEHRRFAQGADGVACRYAADVIPFGGLSEPTPGALKALRDLLTPGEVIYTVGSYLPEVHGLQQTGLLAGLQMRYAATLPDSHELTEPEVEPLSGEHAEEMVELTDIAFPGYFRIRTYELGFYFGIRHHGKLIAMAGERVALPGYREISAVCTHPAHTGKGYAARLISHLLRVHASVGLKSFLHVSAANHRAISLYERLGFTKTRDVLFHQLRRA